MVKRINREAGAARNPRKAAARRLPGRAKLKARRSKLKKSSNCQVPSVSAGGGRLVLESCFVNLGEKFRKPNDLVRPVHAPEGLWKVAWGKRVCERRPRIRVAERSRPGGAEEDWVAKSMFPRPAGALPHRGC